MTDHPDYGKVSSSPIEIDINKDPKISQLEIEMPSDSQVSKFEEMLNNKGFTLFQAKVVLITGLVYFLEGIHVAISGGIFSVIIFNYKTSSFFAGIISSCLLLFMSVGSLVAGQFTQSFQRKKVLLFFIGVITMATLLSSIQFIIMLMISRCMIGFSLGIVIPIATNNLAEILPSNYRSFWLISITSFFSVGAVFSLNLLNYCLDKIGFFFLLLTFQCAFVLLCYFLFYVDNPRYLILIGEHEKGFAMIEKHLNNGQVLDENERVSVIKGVDFGANKEVRLLGKFQFLFRRYFRITFILLAIWVLYSFLINGGIFSFFVGMTYSSPLTPEEVGIYEKQIFSEQVLAISIFYVVFSVASIIAGLVSEIRCIGRKALILIGFGLSSAVCIGILVYDEKFFSWFVLGVFFIHISFHGINSYTVEFYPTRVRDFALGLVGALSRFSGFSSNIIAIFIYSYDSSWNYYLNAAIGIIGIFLTLLLPFDTVNRSLDQVISKKVENKETEEIII